MKKALASDFDNTLYFMDTEERFRAQDVFEILFFRKEGGVFGICTGRSPDSILETCGSFLHPDFIISVSGALIVDGEGKVLDSHALSPDTARAILREFDGEAIMVVHAGGNVYAFGETEYPLQISIREFEELPQDAIYGISMRFVGEKEAEEAAARIKEKYGAEAAPYQNVRHVDVVAAGCSKGTGMCKVREIFGIDRFGGPRYSSWYHWRWTATFDSNRRDWDVDFSGNYKNDDKVINPDFGKRGWVGFSFKLPAPDREKWGLISLKNASNSYVMRNVKIYKTGSDTPTTTIANTFAPKESAEKAVREGSYTVTFEFINPDNNKVTAKGMLKNVKVNIGKDRSEATTSISTGDAELEVM